MMTTPIAVSAVSAEALETKDITSLETLENFTPGFTQIPSTFGRNDRGYESYQMRGIYGGDGQYRQPVQIFVDNVPIASGMIAGLDGIDNVETVRGPQSAYFGRSTFAGAINFVTRTPSFTPSVNASVEGGMYGYTEARVSAEGPLIDDKLSGRISARYYTQGGEYPNAYPGTDSGRLGAQETKSVSGSLYYKPIDGLRIKVFGQFWEDDDGISAQGLLNSRYRNCNPGGTVGLTFTCGGISSTPGATLYQNNSYPQTVLNNLTSNQSIPLVRGNLSDHQGLERKAWQTFSSFEYDLPGKWLLSGNVGIDNDQYEIVQDLYLQPAPSAFIAGLANNLSDFSSEVRLTSPTFFDRVKFMIGANYLDASVEGVAVGVLGNTPGSYAFNLSDPDRNYSRTFGLFGSIHVDITDHIKMDFEARNQSDQIEAKILPNALSVPGTQFVSSEATFTTFTPKATFSYVFTPEIMTYFSFAQGSRPGQFNTEVFALNPAAQAAILTETGVKIAVPPEGLDMYEVGFKGEFLDHRLRFTMSPYYGRWYNRQVTEPVLYHLNTADLFVNAISGNSTVLLYGVEAESQFKVTPELYLEGTFAYNQSNIRSTFCSTCAGLTGNGDPTGTTLPSYPVMTGSVSATYTKSLSGLINSRLDSYNGFFHVDYIYSGKQYANEADIGYLEPSNRVNMRFGIRNGRYSFEVYGDNIFNDKTPIGITTVSNFLQGGYGVQLSPPDRSTFGGRVSVHY